MSASPPWKVLSIVSLRFDRSLTACPARYHVEVYTHCDGVSLHIFFQLVRLALASGDTSNRAKSVFEILTPCTVILKIARFSKYFLAFEVISQLLHIESF